jgi:hypothetical protein
VKNRRIGYASKLQATVDVFFGSIATYSARVNGRLMSAVPRNRPQSQSIGICCDGHQERSFAIRVRYTTKNNVLLNF